MPAEERLQDLRRRCASTENRDTLVAEEGLLEPIASFLDRVHEKLDRISAVPKAARGEKRMAAACRAADRVGQQSPQIVMKMSKWEIDEFGNRSRIIYAEGGAVVS
jgi:hypothetical protein